MKNMLKDIQLVTFLFFCFIVYSCQSEPSALQKKMSSNFEILELPKLNTDIYDLNFTELSEPDRPDLSISKQEILELPKLKAVENNKAELARIENNLILPISPSPIESSQKDAPNKDNDNKIKIPITKTRLEPADPPLSSAVIASDKVTEAQPQGLPKAPPPSVAQSIAMNNSNPVTVKASRSLVIEQGKNFELPFQNLAWTYLGDMYQKKGISYGSRRFENNYSIFILKADKVGNYLLRFQRQDALLSVNYDEYVEVNVIAKQSNTMEQASQSQISTLPSLTMNTGSSSSQEASKLKNSNPSIATTNEDNVALAKSQNSINGVSSGSNNNSSQAQTNGLTAVVPSPIQIINGSDPKANANAKDIASSIDTSNLASSGKEGLESSLPASDTPEAFILNAKNELSANRIQSAIKILDNSLKNWPAGSDEVFYTYALALEQAGPLKDIKKALDFYQRVRDSYTKSPLYDKALERIEYINRFYLQIR